MFGISTDVPSDNLEFKKKHQFPFPLLSDITRDVCMKYGTCTFKKAYYASRITYLIDENGFIQKVFPKVTVSDHAEKVLAVL